MKEPKLTKLHQKNLEKSVKHIFNIASFTEEEHWDQVESDIMEIIQLAYENGFRMALNIFRPDMKESLEKDYS